ncbi:YciI family protein [Nakamurella aerolata]|uniref:Transcription initiation protein n=1 Tax=Nakamurella aerolata TaxID=1656892 RepID=A0A849A6F0_9ACTN|nr:YciI family protein [Nakamurella aerolata]NNG35003.1 transcription initiation protein [Nakamurella aerolata]
MTEYVVLITGNPDRWWTTMSEEQRRAGYAEYNRFGEELGKRGHRITGGAELHGSSDLKLIPPGGGPATDGPFAETTEQVGGFYQVETDDLDDLVECCQIIAALGDGIQVRRTVTPQERPDAPGGGEPS